jgi:RND superfamily putative drug exporter
MTSLTRLSLRHRRLVALLWLTLTAVGVLTVSSATRRLSHGFSTPGTAGYDANAHIFKRLGIDGNEQPTIGVLTLPAGETMSTAAGQAAAARTFAAADRAGHLAVADYANTHNPRLVSKDGRTTWALIDMPNPDVGSGVGVIDRIGSALRGAAPPGASVAVTGFEQIQSGSGAAGGGPSVLVMTLIGAAGALAVLLFVYGSAIALVPLLTAAPSILTTFLLVLGLTHLLSMNFLTEYLVAVMGLGVAIDYSLLLITRWREEREAGRTNEDAILAAGSTAGRAVVLSGTIVAVGLLSLVLLPVSFLRSIGLAGMLIPLVAIAATTTLLPVILATLGPALDVRRVRRGSSTYSHTWESWGRLVVRRRWITGIAGLAIVLALAAPALSMNTGQPRANALGGTGQPAQTLHTLERQGVPSAVTFPIQILTHGGPAAVEQARAIARATPGVYTVLAPATPAFRQGRDALLSVIPTAEGNIAAGTATIIRVRAALAHVPGHTEVGGNTAQNVDFNTAVYGNFPLMLAAIAIVTFLLLARTLRSIVLAAKAVVVNIVSLGATFGFLVLFWQNGHGSNLIYGVPATGSIRNWIPIITFAFLFGISMDYEVFILARIREEHDLGRSTNDAIIQALARTGRLVTCAALIIAISFASLSADPDIVVEMIATGLAIGVLIDAVIVRTLLVPALVAIMGRWNWWMPHRIARILRVTPTAAPDDPARAGACGASGDALGITR